MKNTAYRVLKSLRVLCGITQEEMGKAIGRNTSSYSAKERGEVPFTLDECSAVKKHINKHLEKIGEEVKTLDQIFLR